MLTILSMILVGLVALEHLFFLYLEMFAWTTPRVQRIFGTTPEIARDSKALAANQGLYNGFLAAGLIWGLSMGAAGHAVQLFFLGCVIVAGVYGAISVGLRILFVQAVPAALAVAAILLRW